MNVHTKKTLLYLLGALLVFIAGVLALDSLNSKVGQDIERYKNIIEAYEAIEASASETE